MRSRLVLALAALLAFPALAAAQRAQTAHATIGYDVATTTLTFCTMNGARGTPWGEPMQVAIPVKTTGSSQSVTAVTGATNPFARLVVGDTIFVRLGDDVTDMVWIETKTDGDNITVDTAVNWDRAAGYVFEWLDLVCGTTEDDGWIPVGLGGTVAFTVQYEAGDLGGLDVKWEAKEASPISKPVRVYPGTSSLCGDGTLNGTVCTFAAGDRLSINWAENHFSFYRIGLAYRASDGGTREEVHAVFTHAGKPGG